MKRIPAGLLAAYRITHYRVHGSAVPFALKIGDYSPELAALYKQYGARCAVYITAHNPYSKPTSAADNLAAQLRLEGDLRGLGHVFFEGVGFDPDGKWPGEPSLLVLGVRLRDARKLMDRYRQNAVVWVGKSAVPRLIV